MPVIASITFAIFATALIDRREDGSLVWAVTPLTVTST
jgi:hypothetical protein